MEEDVGSNVDGVEGCDLGGEGTEGFDPEVARVHLVQEEEEEEDAEGLLLSVGRDLRP